MARILGIETSCDETAAAVFDTDSQRIISHALFSQIDLHQEFGGVVPEIASRSHLEKIDIIVQKVLDDAACTLDDLDAIGVTHKPGLVGSLLIGVCFAKTIAWALQKKLIGVNHLEGHIFSAFLQDDGSVNRNITFPHINLSVSGGHTSLYRVEDFGHYNFLGQTIDDAAGEAFDKVSKVLGLGYPGGPIIEKYAARAGFKDVFAFPRTKNVSKDFSFTFSGLKTAVLYTLVKHGAYDLKTGPIQEKLTEQLREDIASSLLVCMGDIFKAKLKLAFQIYPDIQGFTFVGGVACNNYLRTQLAQLCADHGKWFYAAPRKFCVDNGAMIAFVASYKYQQNDYSPFTLDVLK